MPIFAEGSLRYFIFRFNLIPIRKKPLHYGDKSGYSDNMLKANICNVNVFTYVYRCKYRKI